MKILFTGASSFTGYWFIKELTITGHNVISLFTKSPEAYEGNRKLRIDEAAKVSKPIFNISFGDESFISLLENEAFDILCHHAADVTNYKNTNFNIHSALGNNTNNLLKVLEVLKRNSCKVIMLTGSIFEQGEGKGSDGLPAFSPYGLSKYFTSEVFRYYCKEIGINLAKFVIPNPFGPYEDPRFTTYLAKIWLKHETAFVKTPFYIRDNIHASLLAKSYVYFLEKALREKKTFLKFNPSGIIGSQGEFTEIFSDKMKTRLNLPCQFELNKNADDSEPLERVNTEPASEIIKNWDEEAAWDELADYYLEHLL